MRNLALVTAFAVSLAAAPASAVTIAATSGTGAVTFTNAVPGSLQADVALRIGQSVTLDLEVEAGDAAGISFSSIVSLFAGLGARAVTIDLSNGAFFSTIGSIVPAFSSATIGGTSSSALIRFSPREFVEVAVGNTGFGGTDWVITPSPGDIAISDFTLTVAAVPAPAALALFGLGFVGLAAARRCA
jgi:hypothetical protein